MKLLSELPPPVFHHMTAAEVSMKYSRKLRDLEQSYKGLNMEFKAYRCAYRNLILTMQPFEVKFMPKLWLESYVYFVLDSATGLYKIGRSRQPKDRVENMRTGASAPLYFAAVIHVDDMVVHERLMHRRFDDKRVRGEWFGITQQDIIRAIIDYDTIYTYENVMQRMKV